ncbi:class I SAM-dependent methyltransferase family protein [Thermoplasma sp. Kam2015]|uniref:class I SAM-dependent methyltransferase n=1 Tax=Thermoplasma sp. Kam2015 TaxID=2094122 RepID=UPI000D8E857B|nr:class I SAM-dependent methyltransferase family protein [Thermoplasma sp. Kam2015]PYB68251.1 class I SAM-dependent methyltransferase family protein [Thermoplasma sp. Kam2015]
MPPKKFVKAPKSMAEKIITDLRAKGIFDRNFSVIRNGEFIYIPVRDDYSGEHIVIDAEPRITVPSASGSFDTIGNIVIMKRYDEALAHDILKTHRNIRSVFYDDGVAGSERKRKLRLIAGDGNTVTEYRENGCSFIIDISKAYFSPRLATERRRLIDQVSDGEFIFDMFAGVGPISIEIARYHRVRIIASDINCEAINMLQQNMTRNALRGVIEPVCADARSVASEISEADRVIMNNPTASFSFLPDALKTVRVGGTVNYYEFLDRSGLESRLVDLKSVGLEPVDIHRVHSYSKTISLYSMTLKKGMRGTDHLDTVSKSDERHSDI